MASDHNRNKVDVLELFIGNSWSPKDLQPEETPGSQERWKDGGKKVLGWLPLFCSIFGSPNCGHF